MVLIERLTPAQIQLRSPPAGVGIERCMLFIAHQQRLFERSLRLRICQENASPQQFLNSLNVRYPDRSLLRCRAHNHETRCPRQKDRTVAAECETQTRPGAFKTHSSFVPSPERLPSFLRIESTTAKTIEPRPQNPVAVVPPIRSYEISVGTRAPARRVEEVSSQMVFQRDR